MAPNKKLGGRITFCYSKSSLRLVSPEDDIQDLAEASDRLTSIDEFESASSVPFPGTQTSCFLGSTR